MTWFEKILNEDNFNRNIFDTSSEQGGDDTIAGPKTTSVPHEANAFRVGDIVTYTKNTGHGVIYPKGKITSVTPQRVKIDGKFERDIYKQARINPQLCCDSWIQAIENCKLERRKVLVSYETSTGMQVTRKGETVDIPEGVELVVLLDRASQRKYYNKWENGSCPANGYYGFVDVKAQNLSNNRLMIKRGDVNHVHKVNAGGTGFDASQYTEIPKQFASLVFLTDRTGKFYAWNYNKVNGVLALCPWLRDVEAPWATVYGNKKDIIVGEYEISAYD